MTDLPDPTYLSLSGARNRIARAVSKNALSDAVLESFYGALCDGKLAAIGDFEDHSGKTFERDQVVFPEDWRLISETEFSQAISRHRLLNLRPSASSDLAVFFTNVRIETRQLDAWLAPPAPVKNDSRLSIISKETECTKWLRAEAPRFSIVSKSKVFEDAKQKFPGLTKRGFDRSWAEVSTTNPKMSAPGRKRSPT